MTAITFDTLKFTKRLEEAGVPRKQAEAQAEAFRDAQEAQLGDLVTTKRASGRDERIGITSHSPLWGYAGCCSSRHRHAG